jgi:hypothetical protein
MQWFKALLARSDQVSTGRPLIRREPSWDGWQRCKMPDWVQDALGRSGLDIDRDEAPAQWEFEVSGKTFRYRVIVEAGFIPREGRPVLSETCYRKPLRSDPKRNSKHGRLAYKTKGGKRVWLYATERDDFEPDESWVRTGRTSVTNGLGSGRIREGLPQWVWDILAESPRIEEGTRRVYLVNGENHQYLYGMYVDEEGDIFRETYRRRKP